MDSRDYLTHLHSELTAFEECLAGDLSARIEHCGDWTLHDLADHLGRSNLWAARAVTEKRSDYPGERAPRDRAELVTWFGKSSMTLLRTLDRDPSVPAWTFYPPHTVGFWQRRRCLETLVHRWDAEHALGITNPLDPTLAGDGVTEVIDTMAPLQVERGHASTPGHAIRLLATDTRSSWTYGPGAPVATISATAENLLLMLWGRVRSGDRVIRWEGDRAAAQTVLDGPLVS